ncbi:hypothetical protein AVEN_153125-1 [Araneus ventricosus]|uniref:Uncharacterized protein n=1 Tax=Araneus ventricosus TaxID=182803 RepID=A0A4Y2IGV7_ARAVE|nr:hypothetical protein AVEN_153125-1 [Araneus ventricosus]
MDYWNNVIPLEDKALVKVTQNFCQDRSFKEAVLGFACAYPQNEVYYMTEEEREEIRHYFYSSAAESYAAFIRARYFRYERCLNNWETVMEEYIQRILKNSNELPEYFQDEAKEWISRHIFEYLSYCRRLEVLTGLSRYFFVDFVTNEDWNTEGRLDEKILAERLIADERLTVLQRYRIACTYCLTSLRRRLWRQLTPEERSSLNQNDDPLLTFEYNRSVLFWSYHMKGGRHYKVSGEANPWMGAAEIAVYDGNVFALRESWKNLQFCRQGEEASNMAFRCFNQWKICKASDWKRKLLALDCYSSPWTFSDFCLPTHYARMISFLFKNMDEDELEMFFEELLAKRKDWDALIYFLDWPNLDYFLPMIKSLQSFIPDEALKMVYLESLLTLASRHQTQQELPRYPNKIKINGLYDYRSVLRKLWDETPKKYKRYAFKDTTDANISKEYRFLTMLLEKNPFLEEDEWLFIRVFRDATVREKKVFLMSSQWKKIYVTLVLRENWSLLDRFTKESFDEDENAIFRHWYIISSFGRGFCFDLLLKNKETVLNDLICWSLNSEDERRTFKRNLIYELPHIDECLSLISEDNFLEVERIMNFCLEFSEIQDFKKRLANDDAFYSLILNHEWAILDRYVAWCFETEEKIAVFKKNYFSSDGVDLYFHFVFREYLYDIERFYQWFDLSPEAVEKLKKDTVFSSQFIDYITGLLHSLEPLPVILLLWSLKDEEMILDLKSTLESHLLDDSNETNMAEYKLHCLVQLLLTLKGLNQEDCYIPDQVIRPVSAESCAS